MTIPSWARVGEKVVCVTTRDMISPQYDYSGDLDGLTKGAVYTISGVYFSSLEGKNCLILNEIERPVVEGVIHEAGFIIHRFRPLTTTKTQAEDVAMIRSLIKDEVNA